MFVQDLNERQQCVLLRYADAVIRVDNRIDPSELVAMHTLRDQVRPGTRPEEVPIEQIGDIFRNRNGRVSLLLELVGMDRRQSALIEQIAGALDLLQDGTLEAIDQWVRDQFGLMVKARELMQGT